VHRKMPAWFGPGVVGKGAAPSGNLANGLPVLLAAVRLLNQIELVGETVRACLEALAATDPGWTAAALDASWQRRYAARVDTWRMPSSKTKRVALGNDFARDGHTLLHAVWHPDSPEWLRELRSY
jgi:hypothetical protein